jgi:NTE family protein
MALRVGIALSSGGAAGIAHIGVIEELTKAGISIDCVAGTSAGAMVGGAFAAGQLDEFRRRVLSSSRRRRTAWFDPVWPRCALLGGRHAMALLGPCAAQNIEDMPLRFAAVATDLDSAERIALGAGPLRDAVRASIAIPGIFAPLCRRGRLLVDGALTDPVPVGPARDLGATFVIASSVIGSAETALTTRCFAPRRQSAVRRFVERALGPFNPRPAAVTGPLGALVDPDSGTAMRTDGLADILCKASAVVQTTIAAVRLRDEPPDFLIAPAAYEIGVFELQRAEEAIELGRAAARAALPDLLAALEAAQGYGQSFRWWPTATRPAVAA